MSLVTPVISVEYCYLPLFVHLTLHVSRFHGFGQRSYIQCRVWGLVKVPINYKALSYDNGTKPLLREQTDFDISVGQCYVSDENSAS